MNLENESIIYCLFCGKSIMPNSFFCENCGRSLSGEILSYNQIIEEIENYKKFKPKQSILAKLRPKKNKNYNEDIQRKRKNIEIKLEDYLEKSSARIRLIKNRVENYNIYLIYSEKESLINKVQEIHQSYSKIFSSGILRNRLVSIWVKNPGLKVP